MRELCASIQANGVLQPILVNALGDGNFEIIAGERRWRAARMAGLKEIPALVRAGTESERFQLALIENVQRQDLNPIEQAEGFRRLQQEFQMTQEQIAQAMGKDRAVIANTVRLLNLPENIRRAVSENKITMGHARALLSVEDATHQHKLFERILHEHLPVRDVERSARAHKKRSTATSSPSGEKASEVRTLEDELRQHFGRKVEIHPTVPGAHQGWLRFEFYTLDDLDALLRQLKPPHHGH